MKKLKGTSKNFQFLEILKKTQWQGARKDATEAYSVVRRRRGCSGQHSQWGVFQDLLNEKGMMLVAVVLGMLLFGALGATISYLVANNLADSNEDLQSSQAFYVAEGGMQYVAMNQLNGDTNFSDNVSPTGVPFGGTPISLSPGQFWIEYLNQQTQNATVRITSKVGNAVRVIEQNVGQSGTGYQYVTMAGGNISAQVSTGHVYGDVGLRGNIAKGPGVNVHGNVYQDPAIQLPTLDFNIYKNMCTSTYSGNKTFSSNYTGNLCVNGSVTFNANVTYTGLLYVTNNVSLNGNNVIINGSLLAEGNINGNNRTGLQFNSQSSDPNQHMPAMAGKGNISLQNADGMQVNGLMWNTGNISLSTTDNLQFRGSFIVSGNVAIDVANNLSITFDAALMTGVPGLSGGGGTQTGSLSLSGWKTYAPWW